VNLTGERELLLQAVSNLLQNAIDFTPAGGTVALAVKGEGDRAVLTVTDSGPGVPDYALGRVFEKFFSLARPDTGRKSSGLGLSVVREVAHLHGGESTLENRPEGGVRTTLRLPVKSQAT
jgi:two-component system sensor histidine kinase CreC